MILRARYLFTAEGPVLENGFVRVQDDRIAEVGVGKPGVAAFVEDFGDALICPGFVNAHAHLELSHLADRIAPEGDFIRWLGRVGNHFLEHPPTKETVQAAAAAGVDQSLRNGVTTVGDISRNPLWTREVLARSPLRAVSYGEVIAVGRRRELLIERLIAAVDHSFSGPNLRPGISPHSPYGVEPKGLIASAERANRNRLPICIHLLESPFEVDFVRHGTGPLTDHLRRLDVWDADIPTSDCGPVELLLRTGLLNERTILAHVNYPSEDDLVRIASSGASVAYCPRTHAAFGHPSHSFREMLRAGVNVCVATDSLASNPSLSVLDELRFLHQRFPEMDCATLFEMGTIRAAKALGLRNDIGSIAAGKTADLLVLPLNPESELNPWGSALNGDSPPRAIYVNGEKFIG